MDTPVEILDVTSDAVDTEAPWIGTKSDGAEDVAAVNDGGERKELGTEAVADTSVVDCVVLLPKPLCS